MIKNTIIVYLLLLSSLLNAQDLFKQPLVVLYEANHWTFYPGSESPVFTLYEDGTIIYSNSKEGGFSLDYSYVILDSISLINFINDLNIDEVFRKEKYNNELVNYTCQTQTYFYLFEGNKRSSYYYYGSLRKENKSRNKASKKVVELYDKLAYFTSDQAMQWLPSKYELLIQTGEGSDGVKWPETLPDLESPSTIKHTDFFFSVFLSPSEYKTFEEVFNKKGKDKKFVINGKECFILIRHPFPTENYWMN